MCFIMRDNAEVNISSNCKNQQKLLLDDHAKLLQVTLTLPARVQSESNYPGEPVLFQGALSGSRHC